MNFKRLYLITVSILAITFLFIFNRLEYPLFLYITGIVTILSLRAKATIKLKYITFLTLNLMFNFATIVDVNINIKEEELVIKLLHLLGTFIVILFYFKKNNHKENAGEDRI
tara:strand:+ start:205780 stop:206115 length:336 start_codon:yes stop_codon:yes gene_type:complete